MSTPTRRTAFLVDGFNLYHSLLDSSRDLGGAGTRWLDLRSFCASYLSEVGGGAEISDVLYFSALATFREAANPGTVDRHRAYLDCLRDSGVEIILGKFKQKFGRCHACGNGIVRHEEKETDVAIGAKLLELLWMDRCDAAVIVSGDSDMAPAIRIAHAHFPEKPIYTCFPYKRLHFALKDLVAGSFRVRKERCTRFQFTSPVLLRSGKRVSRPPEWS